MTKAVQIDVSTRCSQSKHLTNYNTSQGIWKRFTFSCVLSWHDDVTKWKHFPCYWLCVPGIHQWPVNSPHKGQWREDLMFSLICTWTNGWVNNRKSGYSRRHRAHYDVTLMTTVDVIHILQGHTRRIGPLPVKQLWRIWMNKAHSYVDNLPHNCDKRKSKRNMLILSDMM